MGIRRTTTLLAMCAVFVVAEAGTALAQQDEAAAPPGESAAAETTGATPPVASAPLPIAVSDVPFRAEGTADAVRRVRALSEPSDTIQDLERALVDQVAVVRRLRFDLGAIDTRRTSVRHLDDHRIEWIELQARLAARRETLQDRWSALIAGRDELRREFGRWDATYREVALNTEEPVALLVSLGEILDSLDEATQTVQQRVDAIASLITRTNDDLQVATAALDRLDGMSVTVRQRLLVRDAEPIWRGVSVADVRRFPADVDQSRQLWVRTLVRFVGEREGRFAVLLGTFVVLLGLALALYRSSRHWVSDESLVVARHVVSRPLALAVLFTLATINVVLPRTVGPIGDIVALLAIGPVLRIGAGIVAPHIRSALYGVSGALVLQLASTLVPNGTEARRVALLVLSVVTLAGAVYLLRRWRRREVTRYVTGRVGTAGIYLAALLLLGSFIANLLGWFQLSQLLWESTVLATYGALAWLVFFRAAVGLLPLIPRSVVGKVVPSIVTYEPSFLARNTQLIALGSFLMWLGPQLERFQLSGAVYSRIEALLAYSIGAGGLELSVGSLLAAIAILVLTFPVARFTQFVLSKEILRRVPLPAGADHTIVAIANYTVIVFGVLMSAAAAGLTGTQLTVVFGALGVGIGFGMQSVVNNFVSGLILMFERPIKIGDKIEASGRLGIVTQIGMRASMIRTFEGAEVVVPNGDLISKEVVNWTLSDQKRRVDVPVQVTEGSDVKQVIRALTGAAARHPDVLTEPAPAALLMALGEGCLNFQLRAWTEKSPINVSSDLHVSVNEALKGAGIRTAIPQLQLKSTMPVSADIVDHVDEVEASERRS